MDQKRSDVLQKPMSNFSRSSPRRTHRPHALLGGAGCAAPEAVKGEIASPDQCAFMQICG